ncbi:MAG: hypothetical protein HYZ63_00410 [Candidatus Andersenbacteria bacterium]|nr:hypothetical protein [Candidatus Andersenbacteria bacterium]
MSEIVLSKANMFILTYAQHIIEFVWQGKKMDIVQATIFTKQKRARVDDTTMLLECEFSCDVAYRDTLVGVRITLDLHHTGQGGKANIWSWCAVNHVTLEIRTIPTLKNVKVLLDTNGTWDNGTPEALCDVSFEEKLRIVWAELGLEANTIVKTCLNKNK